MALNQREASLKEEIFYAAIKWFDSLSPKEYSDRRHYANPTINTKTDAEAELAGAIGRFLKERDQNLSDHDL
jgi:hypothetical protein